MENDNQQQQNPIPQQPEVSFPQPREPQSKKSSAKIVIAVIGVIFILVVGGWFVLGNSSGGSDTPSPTPNGGLSTFPTPSTTQTPSPSPSSTPEPVEKSEVRIEVLNGTGVPGEASFLQGELEDAGFEEITAGNADNQDETETTATFSRDLNDEIVEEITELLEGIYESVRTRKATISGDFDVTITTGPRVGADTSDEEEAEETAEPSPSPDAEEE